MIATTRFQHAYVLNVLSDDHPGIIAAVSGVIVSLHGNIDAFVHFGGRIPAPIQSLRN